MITLQLELTGRCQLACKHCYAESSPTASHGAMVTDDWHHVITQAPSSGIGQVQFIGGEPTMHPDFVELLDHAIASGLRAQVYSNLIRVPDPLWERYACPGVSLATSYYSDDPGEHEAVTGRAGSHAKTRSNIVEAVRRQIPVRASIIDLGDQRVEQARAELSELGVERVRVDRVREVGRGAATIPSTSALCGHCTRTMLAVSPDGDVWPCGMARWMGSAGNVRRSPLAEVLEGEALAELAMRIPERRDMPCGPAHPCNPSIDGDDCQPAETTGGS